MTISEKFLQSLGEEEARKSLKQEIEYKQATQSTFGKVAGALGILYNIPNNFVYNRLAEGKGLPTVPITSSYLDFSDTLEAANPTLRDSTDWKRWRPYMNFAASVGLDLSTYLTLGSGTVTKAGKINKILKSKKLTPALDDVGKILTRGDEIIYTLGKNKDGKAIFLNKTLADIKKNKALYEKVRDTGYLKKEIPKLGETVAEKIAEGSSGMVGLTANPFAVFTKEGITSKVPFRELQATIARKVGSQWGKLVSSDSKIGELLRSGGVVDLERILREAGLDEAANTYKDWDKIPAKKFREATRMAANDAAELRGITQRIRAATGEVDNVADAATGFNRAEINAFTTAYKYGDLGDNGRYSGKVFSLKKGQIVGSADEIFTDLNKTLGKGWKEKYSEFFDKALDMSKRNKGRTAKIKDLEEAVGFQTFLQKNYIKQLDLTRDLKKIINLTKKSSKILTNIMKTVGGSGRTWKGFSFDEVTKHRNKIMHILSKDDDVFSVAEKGAAWLLNDQRLSKGNHTLEDIISLGERADIDDLMQRALKAGDDDTFEMLESAKKVRANYDQLRNKKWVKQTAEGEKLKTEEVAKVLDDIKKVNTNDLMGKVSDEVIDDFYLNNVPALDFFTELEVQQRTSSLKFLDNLFNVGMGHDVGAIKLGKKGEQIAGFKEVNIPRMFKVTDQKVAEIAAKTGQKLNRADEYKYFMRDEIWEAFNASGLKKMVNNPSKAVDVGWGNEVKKWYDDFNTLWKVTTLFAFPAFYIRNVIDNGIKTLVEYTRHPVVSNAEIVTDFKRTMQILKDNMADTTNDLYDISVKRLGKASKQGEKALTDFAGDEWSNQEVWDAFVDNGLMGRGVQQFGLLNENNVFNAFESLKSAKVIDENTLGLAQKLQQAAPIATQQTKLGKLAEKFVGLAPIKKMMDFGEYTESMFRLQVFMKNMKHLPMKEAVQQTLLTAIDYGNLNKFEKTIFSRIFPFYTFQKGTVKYLTDLWMKNPILLKNVIPSSVDITEAVMASPEDRVNKALLPEYLKDFSLRVGKDEDTGTFNVLNLRGLSSIAELVNFAQPHDAILQNLYPHFKSVAEVYANKHFFFKSPIERYPGQEELILGVPFNKKGFPARALKSVRAVTTTERLTESLLKKTPLSLFGTPKKKSLFGLGRTGNREPEKLSTFLTKTILGIPLVEVDLEKSKRGYWWHMKTQMNSLNKNKTFVNKEYRYDPETRNKILKRFNREKLKIITKHSASQSHKTSDKDLGF